MVQNHHIPEVAFVAHIVQLDESTHPNQAAKGNGVPSPLLRQAIPCKKRNDSDDNVKKSPSVMGLGVVGNVFKDLALIFFVKTLSFRRAFRRRKMPLVRGLLKLDFAMLLRLGSSKRFKRPESKNMVVGTALERFFGIFQCSSKSHLLRIHRLGSHF
jgi:hypothetical protein